MVLCPQQVKYMCLGTKGWEKNNFTSHQYNQPYWGICA